MARSRNVKPGYFQNDELAECGMDSHLLFAGLWTIADKEGRLKDRPKRIKAACLPYYQVNVDACLDKLCRAVFLRRYEMAGERFIQIANWHKHQTPHHKEAESEIPSPPEQTLENKGDSNVDPTLDEGQPKDEQSLPQAPGSGIRDQESRKRESENPKSARPPSFDSWWDLVPNKVGKRDAKSAYEKAVKSVARDRGISECESQRYLLERMEAFAASPKAQGQFCPHPSTWLNQGRYDDDPATWLDRPSPNGSNGYDRDAVVSEAERKLQEALNGSH